MNPPEERARRSAKQETAGRTMLRIREPGARRSRARRHKQSSLGHSLHEAGVSSDDSCILYSFRAAHCYESMMPCGFQEFNKMELREKLPRISRISYGTFMKSGKSVAGLNNPFTSGQPASRSGLFCLQFSILFPISTLRPSLCSRR